MPRAKKCKTCKRPFKPFNTLQRTCSVTCAIEDGRKQQEKNDRKRLREFRINNRTLGDWHKLAQPEFNKFIRLRDHHQPCISCGRYDEEIKYSGVGGKFDCGHYLSVGAHPELRYTETNAHKQCKSCNSGTYHHVKKNKTVSQDYRENLIERIGLEKVEWLEGPHPPANFTAEDIQNIKKLYSQKARDLAKELE